MKWLTTLIKGRNTQSSEPYSEFFDFRKLFDAATAEGFQVRYQLRGRIVPENGSVFTSQAILDDDLRNALIEKFKTEVIEKLTSPKSGRFTFRFAWSVAGDPTIIVMDGSNDEGAFVAAVNAAPFAENGCRVELHTIDFDMTDQPTAANAARIPPAEQSILSADQRLIALEQRTIVAALNRVREIEA